MYLAQPRLSLEGEFDLGGESFVRAVAPVRNRASVALPLNGREAMAWDCICVFSKGGALYFGCVHRLSL